MTEEIGPFRVVDETGAVLVWFWEDAKPYTSKKGQQCFASILMMKVVVPGDNKSEIIHEVESVYQADQPHPIFGEKRENKETLGRFAKCVADYKARQGGPAALNGTPIDKAPWLNRAMALTMKHNGIHTVEDLAGLSDSAMERVGMGARGMVQKAKDFLEASAKTAADMQLQDQLRALQGQIDRQQKQLEDLGDVFAEMPPEVQAQAKKSLAKKGHRVAA